MNTLKLVFYFGLGLVIVVNLALFVLMRVVSGSQLPSDPWESIKKGQEVMATKDATIVAVVAHPDDADWYAGGALSRLSIENNVIVVVGTSGEKGGKGEKLSDQREKEQNKAADILGYDEVVFLRYPDRGLKDLSSFVNDVSRIVEENDANIILSFDIEEEGYIYHHSDHRAAGLAAKQAAERSKTVDKLVLFHTKAPNTIIDVASVSQKKTDALAEHKSQQNSRVSKYFRYLPIFVRPRSGGSGSTQQLSSLEIDAVEVYRTVQIRSKGAN